jgi:glutaredoxin
LLKGKGIDFIEVNLDGKDRDLQELKERTGHRTVPQIFINGKMIGGYQDLAALDMRGELERILNP